jgi:hypothetical protein
MNYSTPYQYNNPKSQNVPPPTTAIPVFNVFCHNPPINQPGNVTGSVPA